MRPISRGWRNSLVDLFRCAQRRLLVCTPFVSGEGIRTVTENLQPAFVEQGSLTFLTNLAVNNVCQLTTDPRAIRTLMDAHSQTVVIHLPGLHAKVYLADDQRAIITSGNLTAGGLYRNLEYGVELDEHEFVQQVESEISEFAELGTSIPKSLLIAYSDAIEELGQSINEAQRNAQNGIRQRFRDSLSAVEDELVRLRLGGGRVHTVFAKTIEYLLRRHGPLTTVQIHPLVSTIHPDLCDDTIDRVIDGERFGKKWKHAVRTAQQQLKKQGRIFNDHGFWRITEDVGR